MYKKMLFTLILSLNFVGCVKDIPLPSNAQNINSVTNTEKCQFINSIYIETQPHTLIHYSKLNTYNFGGDSYKIISTNNKIVMGLNVLMVNLEIYKCK